MVGRPGHRPENLLCKEGVKLALFAMVCLLASNAATSVAEFAGIGASMQLFGVSKYLAVPVVAAAPLSAHSVVPLFFSTAVTS